MSGEKAQGIEVNTPTISKAGTRADNPSIVSTIKECAKQGFSKEHAMKITGVPMEIVDKHYKKD